MSSYTIGLDFGTLSLRAVIVDVTTGDILGSFVSEYKKKVMDSTLYGYDINLPKDYALQDAMDYIKSLNIALPMAIKEAKVDPKKIIGIGVDFTSSTILPIKKDGTPLSELKGYNDNPHAYVKLWKHHAASSQANKISELARKRKEKWISRYGGMISSEWMLPKVLEILENSEEVFNETDYFIEAGDFIVYYLTGQFARSSCQAGYKCLWHNKDGYPSKEYLFNLEPRLKDIFDDKLSGEILSIGQSQGLLKSELSKKFGLNTPAVSVAIIDAHVATPSCQVVRSGDMLMIMGTSSCDIVLNKDEYEVEGISGVVKNGAIPNLYAYESGQAAVGDIFSWFMDNCVPKEYYQEAKKNDMNIYQYLEYKVKNIPENKSRLIALDWWNGNRSVLVDPELTGLLIGYDLRTKPEEIYRALIEATAFGKKKIIERYEESGVIIERIVACGGLASKNEYLLQVYSNILNRPIFVSEEEQAPAIGAAIFGSLAAGVINGGYDNIENAVKFMGKLRKYPVIPKKDETYAKLYEHYLELHDYFGKKSKIMKELKKL